ncbi:hypothetical protein PODOV084v1_p0048 [Vibrio phage 340E47.2]|nr:hypothetical protein PODOV084v1_p0048 [Vibrio phage 340E47.2]QZI91954.1 putative inner capsid protein [Vibrio phage 5P1a]
MSWVAAAVVGGAVVSSVVGGKATKKAAKTQSDASAYAADLQYEQFEKSLELQKPYREAGYGALEELQALGTPQGRAQALQGYYAGPEFRQQQAQQTEDVLRAASVTGVRGGSSQQAVASIAPQLGLNYLGQQQNIQSDIANLGQGAAAQGARGATNLGTNLSNIAIQGGQAQANAQLAQGQIYSNAANTVIGAGINYLGRPAGGVAPGATPQTGGLGALGYQSLQF